MLYIEGCPRCWMSYKYCKCNERKKVMKYEVTGYMNRTTYEKVWFEIVASSKEDAIQRVQENPNDYYSDSKELDAESEYVDQQDWTIKED